MSYQLQIIKSTYVKVSDIVASNITFLPQNEFVVVSEHILKLSGRGIAEYFNDNYAQDDATEGSIEVYQVIDLYKVSCHLKGTEPDMNIILMLASINEGWDYGQSFLKYSEEY